MLCPQQWAQQAQDHYPIQEGTYSTVDSQNIVLYWGQRKYKKTVPLPARLNVGIVRLAAGSTKLSAFVAELDDHQETMEKNIFEAHVIPNNDDSVDHDDNVDDNDRLETSGADCWREAIIVMTFQCRRLILINCNNQT